MLGIKPGNFPSIPLWYVQFWPLVDLISGGRMQYLGCDEKLRYEVVDSALKANHCENESWSGRKKTVILNQRAEKGRKRTRKL